MTWQVFLPKGNGIQKKSNKSNDWTRTWADKLPLAQCAQLLLILGYKYGLKFKTQVAP